MERKAAGVRGGALIGTEETKIGGEDPTVAGVLIAEASIAEASIVAEKTRTSGVAGALIEAEKESGGKKEAVAGTLVETGRMTGDEKRKAAGVERRTGDQERSLVQVLIAKAQKGVIHPPANGPQGLALQERNGISLGTYRIGFGILSLELSVF